MKLQRRSIFIDTIKCTPIGLAFLALSFTIVSLLNPINPSNADEQVATSEEDEYSASISIDGGAEIVVNPAANQQVFTGTNEITYTNSCPRGFTVTLSSSSEDTALTRTGEDTLTKTIPSVDVASTLLDDTWGFNTDGGDIFNPIPPLGSPVTIFDKNGLTETPATLSVTYGLKTNNNMPSGAYTKDIIYTVLVKPQCMGYRLAWDLDGGDVDEAALYTSNIVGYGAKFNLANYKPTKAGYTLVGWETEGESFINVNDVSNVDINTDNDDTVVMKAVWGKTLHQISTMQEMTSQTCKITTTPYVTAIDLDWDGSHSGDKTYVPRKSLIDTRDNNNYLVSKLADGNCWMSQNLALDLIEGQPVEASNVDGTTVMVTPGNTTQQGTSVVWESNSDIWRSYHPNENEAYIKGGTKKASSPTGSGVEYDWEKTGNYYNWHTATAGTGASARTAVSGDTTTSLCPKGWRLPSHDLTLDATKRHYEYLISSEVYRMSGTAGVMKLHSAPIDTPLAGYYSHSRGVTSAMGTGAYYWTSTPYKNKGYATRLHASTSALELNNSGAKGYGYPIRCVAI